MKQVPVALKLAHVILLEGYNIQRNDLVKVLRLPNEGEPGYVPSSSSILSSKERLIGVPHKVSNVAGIASGYVVINGYHFNAACICPVTEDTVEIKVDGVTKNISKASAKELNLI